MNSPHVIEVLKWFERAAHALGARAAIPMRDGSLLFAYSRSRSLLWSPVQKPNALVHPRLPGSLVVHGFATDALKRAVRALIALQRVRPKTGFDPIALFPPLEPGESPIAALRARLQPFLQAGVTRWGPFACCAIRETDLGALVIEFDSGEGSLTIEVAEPAGAAAAGGLRFGAVLARVADDSRAPALSSTLHGAVDRYMWYALGRALGASEDTSSVGSGASAQSAPVAPTVKSDAARQASSGLCGGDECSPDSFFGDPEERHIGSGDLLSTLYASDEAVGILTYMHKECEGKLPSWTAETEHIGYDHHRLVPLPVSMPRRRMEFVLPRELDISMGKEGRLRKRMRAAVTQPSTKMVAVVGTCANHLTGFDVEGIAGEIATQANVPLTFIQLAVDRDNCSCAASGWSQLFSVMRRDLATRPGVVNLVGYAPEHSRVARELAFDLQQLGVEARFIVPSFRASTAERFLEASITLVNTAHDAASEFQSVREALGDAPVRECAPPIGPQRTLAMVKVIAQASGTGRTEDEVASLWERHSSAFERMKARARAHRAAVVLGATDAEFITNPNRLYGVDIVDALREMGFGVQLLCLTGPSESAAKVLEDHFARTRPGDEEVRVEAVPRDEPLSHLLERTEAALVFTDFPPDARIWGAGKHSFHVRDLELGFRGSLRSIARLVRRCEGRYFAAFSPGSAEREP